MSLRNVARTLVAAAAVSSVPAAALAQHPHAHGASTASQAIPKNAQVVEIAITKEGFIPSRPLVKLGAPVALVVTRKVERTCATEIVLKDFGVNQALPLDKPVTVVVNPKKAGTYRFACGMDMIAGELRVQ